MDLTSVSNGNDREGVLEGDLLNPIESQKSLEPFEPPINKKFATPDHVLEWRKYYLREGHSVHSTTTYFNYIKLFVDYGIEIDQKAVDRFRAGHPSGVVSAALKNFFGFLVKKKGFPMEVRHIYFDKTKTKRKFPESLDLTEVEKIISGMPTLKDKYFTLVMANLGLRISECLKLKWEDFSWISWLQDRTKQGSVNLKDTKGGKFRTIPISVEIMEMLYSDNVNPNKTSQGIPIGNLVFNYGIEDYLKDKEKTAEENIYAYMKYASDRYRRILRNVTKDNLNKKIHPHMFRHFKAQYLLDKGLSLASLKAYLGHSSIVSTEIYAQASAETLKKELDNLDKKNEIQP